MERRSVPRAETFSGLAFLKKRSTLTNLRRAAIWWKEDGPGLMMLLYGM
jgi:hypothetical protein